MLESAETIAVVGLSDNPERSSYGVAKYLMNVGYKIIPVNPKVKEVFGIKSAASLKEITEQVDIVNIFRRSELVLPVVKEAIEIHAKGIWMQEGVYNENAAEIARNAGIPVIMDNCIAVAHRIVKYQLHQQ
ncbi:MAG: CoA-binding protein [Bacteroidota bacterium]